MMTLVPIWYGNRVRVSMDVEFGVVKGHKSFNAKKNTFVGSSHTGNLDAANLKVFSVTGALFLMDAML